MSFSYVRGDLVFEDVLGSLDLELPEARFSVLRAIYDHVNARFPIDARAITIAATENLADFRLTISAFGGVGRVDVTPTGFRSGFDRMTTVTDWPIVGDFIGLVEDAVRSRTPAERVAARVVQRFVHLSGEQGFGTQAFLENLVSERARLQPQSFGSIRCEYGVKLRLTGEGSATELLLESSLHPGASLFVHSTTRYEGAKTTARESLADSERQMRELIAGYGIAF